MLFLFNSYLFSVETYSEPNGKSLKVLKKDLAERIINLDPEGNYRQKYSSTIKQFLTDDVGTKGAGVQKGGRWDTYEANFGLSYKWISAKASVTLGDWYGAERETGWDV